ncbi:MAG: hypothetical protein IPL35_07170 [Sphingobacteriales bacterium]|nr:hypothetical protein [Sphingobacteriales bacterium]
MKLAFKIAKRYLIAKKSTNAINIIAGISLAGMCIGAMALILVLSAFNGFEDLVVQLYATFNPGHQSEQPHRKSICIAAGAHQCSQKHRRCGGGVAYAGGVGDIKIR